MTLRGEFTVAVGSRELTVSVIEDGDPDRFSVVVNGVERSVEVLASSRTGAPLLLKIDGRVREFTLRELGGWPRIAVALGGNTLAVECRTALEQALDKASREKGAGRAEREVRTRMPGKVVAVKVRAGDSVGEGQSLLVLEAMKMENEIRARGPALVRAVHVAVGQTVETGSLLVELEPIEG